MSNHGKVWWNELTTRDPEKAKAYYGAVMGWTFTAVETAGTDEQRPYYIAMRPDGTPAGGVFTVAGPMFDGVLEHWFTYIAVDDLNASIAASKAQGGQCMREPFEIPSFGTLAVVDDPGGCCYGLIQPAE